MGRLPEADLGRREMKERALLHDFLSGWLGGRGLGVRLQEMIPLYYRARGWDASGNPMPGKLYELGLSPGE
jgi:aldehyde:ferredoxin oxidoreductase